MFYSYPQRLTQPPILLLGQINNFHRKFLIVNYPLGFAAPSSNSESGELSIVATQPKACADAQGYLG
jgi:hypothetical protein